MTRKLLTAASILRIITAVVIGLFSVIVIVTRDSLYDAVIRHSMTFADGSDTYKAWQTNDPPLILDLYFFNWTNADRIYDRSVKPHFVQCGPYRFYEIKEKYDIEIHDNGTVTFKYVQKYYVHEDSPRPMTDVITTVNPVALTAAYKSRHANFFVKMTNNFIIMMEKSNITATHTVQEWLFDGFEDRVMNTVRKIPIVGSGVQERFGWFYNKNHSYDVSGVFSMFTRNDENFGKVEHWNHEKRTNFFDGPCGQIHGSAGEFHPMNRERNYLEIYSSELCSYARIDYEKDVDVKGIQAYKYSADTLFDNGTRVPEYKCFCNGGCIPSGLHNVSFCRMNSPVFLSLPHFYNADPYYTNLVDGLTPNKENHDFYIAIEPKSAIVVDIKARMQLNMLLQPIPGFTLYKKETPTAFIPIFYFDQQVLVADDLALKIMITQYIPLLLVTISVILLFIAIVINFPVFFILYKAFCNPNMERTPVIKSINSLHINPELMPLNSIHTIRK